MRKRNFLYIMLATTSLTSCLEEDPMYSLNSKTAFEDIRTAELAMKGCYGYLTTYDAYGQASQELLAGASGLGWAQTSGADQDRFGSLNASNACTITKMHWKGLYKTISECCFFIENVERSPLTDEQKSYLSSHAYFLRGLSYYNLMTTFGGVPLRNNTPTSGSLSLPRASREEIVEQIESDFQNALLGLKKEEANGLASRYAAHAYLAKLYWYMGSKTSDTEYWNKSKVHCDSVYLNSEYALEPNFSTLWGNYYAGKESIFQLNFSTTSSSTGNRGNWLFAPQNSTQKGISWGRIRSSKAFHDLFVGRNPDDPRYESTFLYTWVNSGNGETQYAYPYLSYKEGRKTIVEKIDYATLEDPTNPKVEELTTVQKKRFCGATGDHQGWAYFKKGYDYVSEAQNSNKNVVLFRYADFLLMMADVENELGNTPVAVDLANKVLTRARNSATPASEYPKDLSASLTKEEAREAIFFERLFELAGETTLYEDTRRRGEEFLSKIVEINNNHHITYTLATSDTVGIHRFRDRIFNEGNITADFLKKNLLLPIPQEEMNTNEMIGVADQNFGY